jgi:vancomycin resistance protein YoaR
VNVNAGGSEIDPSDTFADNVTVQGVSVGGMTASEARIALNPTIKEMMSRAVIRMKVPAPDIAADETADSIEADEAKPAASTRVVEYTASEAGISVDVDSALQQAMAYSVNNAPQNAEDAPLMDFTMMYVLDDETLLASLSRDAASWSLPAKDAAYVLKTNTDEDDLTTSAEPVKQEGVEGSEVDLPSLTQKIKDMVASQAFGLIEAPVRTVQPEVTAGQLPELEVIGTYSTQFSTSIEYRMFNIWKISSILNGQSIAPGDTISVNDVVGPRTEEGGWAMAPGIENGVYTDQAGGGICQVSSTLYIAALKAELKIADRTHHTIPSTYVPLGLDATISTGWPDLKLENNTEYPILIGINCDVPDRRVEVKLFGYKPRDYTLRFESVIVQTVPAPADEYIANPETPPGPPVLKMAPHEGYTVDVYKIWYNKDGKETDRKRIYSDTYKPLSAKYEYNPTTPPAPTPAPGTGTATTPTPTPTVMPTETAPPSESPTDPEEPDE